MNRVTAVNFKNINLADAKGISELVLDALAAGMSVEEARKLKNELVKEAEGGDAAPSG